MMKPLLSAVISFTVIFIVFVALQLGDSNSEIRGILEIENLPELIILKRYDFEKAEFKFLAQKKPNADGTFHFGAKDDYPALYQIELGNRDYIFPLDQKGKVIIIESESQAQIKGSPQANAVTAFKTLVEDANKRYFGDLMATKPEKFQDSSFVKEKMTLYKKRLKGFYLELESAIHQMGNSAAAIYCLRYLDMNKSFSFLKEKINALENNLSKPEMTVYWRNKIHEAQKVAIDQKAPWMSGIRDLEGNTIDFRNHVAKYTFIEFWAGWCKPCLIEIPLYQDLYGKYHHKGLEIIGVNMDFQETACRRVTKRMQLSWPVIFDANQAISKLYQVSQLPQNVLIDSSGIIIAKNITKWELASVLKEKL